MASKSGAPRSRPPTTPEARENELISLAQDLVKKRLLEGTASAQETVHYLKLGSSREKLEQQKLEQENLLTENRIEALKSQARVEELYLNAFNAFRGYSGQAPEPEDEIPSEYQ